MDCRDCLERLYEYLDKELSPDDVATVRRHIDDCRGCSDHFFFEASLIEKIHDACADDRAPAHLRERIILRLSEVRVTREREV